MGGRESERGCNLRRLPLHRLPIGRRYLLRSIYRMQSSA
nr:MAG TPA: hypothetical protein [Caudoviricetes sp.]